MGGVSLTADRWPLASASSQRIVYSLASRLVTPLPRRQSCGPYESGPPRPSPSPHGRRGGCRRRAGGVDCPPAHDARCLPAAGHPDHLRRATLRRHGPGTDGGLPHLLLRIPLPLHHRHRACGVQVHPGREPDEAPVPSRHGHERRALRGGCLREPLARLHAAGHPGAVRHALRRGFGASRLPRFLHDERQPHRRRDADRRAESSAPALRAVAGRVRAAALRWGRAHHSHQREARPPAQLRHLGG